MRKKVYFLLCILFVAVFSVDNEYDRMEEYDFDNIDELLMDPIPENISLTAVLEEELKYDRVPECTTIDDTDGDLMAVESFARIRIRRSKWKNFNVYIDPSYNQRDRTLINNGMARLAGILQSCTLRLAIFRPGVRPVGDYIHIFKGKGCWSLIGKVGGRQRISLQSPGCMGVGTIMHELIHSLGFHHEQNRPDRDSHVKILWQNIPGTARSQFEKRSVREVTTYGVRYDQNSIMHYGSTAFSKNGQPTIVAKNGKPVGPKGQLTPNDIQKLKRMYC